MLNKISTLILLGTIFLGTLSAQECVEPTEAMEERLKTTIYYLADDLLEGRDAGSAGEKMAYSYIISQMKLMNLTPYGDNESYLQSFTFKSPVRVGEETQMQVNGAQLKLGEDFYPLPYSDNTLLGETSVIEVGFGITAPELKYDDYKKKIAYKGNVFLINYSSPDGVHPHSKYLKYHDLENRIKLAVEKGAAGVLVYNPDNTIRNPSESFNQIRMVGEIPVAFVSEEAAAKIKAAGKIDMLNVEMKETEKTAYNVVGFKDNGAEKTVVVGAHYDHLGYGEEGSRHRGETAIHNGADDNASGTAGLIEIARYLSMQEGANNNYLFVAFSAEEKGLLGSKYIADHSPIAIEDFNYMINMDMIGRLNEERKLAIYGVGTSPVWKSAIENLKCFDFQISTMESGTGPSDHTSFYLKDIPVLHFFTGTHQEYHKPSDDVETINYKGTAEVVAYIESMINMMNEKGELEFTKTKEENSGNAPRFTVTMGVMPDYTFEGEGMKIDGVTEDKPADKAGIKAGDIVTKMGDLQVRDMMGYMQALSVFKRGQEIDVIIIREGKEQTVKVKF